MAISEDEVEEDDDGGGGDFEANNESSARINARFSNGLNVNDALTPTPGGPFSALTSSMWPQDIMAKLSMVTDDPNSQPEYRSEVRFGWSDGMFIFCNFCYLFYCADLMNSDFAWTRKTVLNKVRISYWEYRLLKILRAGRSRGIKNKVILDENFYF